MDPDANTLAPRRDDPRRGLRGDLIAVGMVALAACAVQMATISRYGVFRDEMYYVACGEHLAWGYVDHPPLVAVVAWFSRHVLGHSLPALRILPVLMGAATIFVTGGIARRLGGGRFAQVLAATGVAVAPQYLFDFHVMSMNCIEVLLWAVAFYLALQAVEGSMAEPAASTPTPWAREPRDQERSAGHATSIGPDADRIRRVRGSARFWLAFGVVCGLGLLNKHSMLFLGMGVFIGLLLTPARRVLRSPWPWVAAAIAGAMFLPHVYWQMTHDWPTLEFIRNAKQYKIAALSPAGFLEEQVMLMNPFTFPIWLAGLGSFLFGAGRRYRFIGWCYLAVLVLLIVQRSKAYYLSPVYTVLLAGGAVAIERLLARKPWTKILSPRARAADGSPVPTTLPRSANPKSWPVHLLQGAILSVLVLGGAIAAPLVVPLMSPEGLIGYMKRHGLEPSSGERQRLGTLPQHYADMFGWEDLARTVAEVYAALPAQERATARVFAQNYGEAGAIDFFRDTYDLPPVICAHNNYWFWGPRTDGGTLIIIGGSPEDHLKALEHVEEVARRPCAFCMPYEADLPIYVCRGWKVSLRAIWAAEKHFI